VCEALAEGVSHLRQGDEVGDFVDDAAHQTHARIVVEGLDLGLALPEELAERSRAFGLGGEEWATELVREGNTRVGAISDL